MASNGVSDDAQRTEKYDYFLGQDFSAKVAAELDNFYVKGLLTGEELDERACNALKEMDDDNAILAVLKKFEKSELSHVKNKSAYLCGMIKTHRQKMKMNPKAAAAAAEAKGPDEAKIKELLDRTGYSLDVKTGQRTFSKPKPEGVDELPIPPDGAEVFIGKLPKDIYEDEIVPLLERCGELLDLRLMMDGISGQNRGYAFASFTTAEGGQDCVSQLNGYKIKENWALTVNVQIPKSRLYVGSIPKTKTKEEIMEEFAKIEDGLIDVIVYHAEDKKKNRGFAFLEYDSHKSAASAKRKLSSGKTKVWNQTIYNMNVDWADPINEPDSEVMAKVKVAYIKNLNPETTEEKIKEDFEKFGEVEKVKKQKDYCFVHYNERDGALKAIEEMNDKEYEGATIQVSLAKPPQENKKKKDRERRQKMRDGGFNDGYGSPRGRGRGGRGGAGAYGDGGGYWDYPPPWAGGYDDYYGFYPPPPHMRGRGMGMRGGPLSRGSFLGQRGARGAPRGGRGGPRGGPGGNRGGRGGRGGAGGKRKMDGGQGAGDAKRSKQGWGSKPIAQQPLGQGGYDYSSGYGEWASDSYYGSW